MHEFVLNVGSGRRWLDSLDDFTRGYVEAAFFTTTYGDSPCLELNDYFTVGELSDDAQRQIVRDCAAFQQANHGDIVGGFIPSASHPEVTPEWRGGTDFWYTRNGHGVGFWETDRWEMEAGERLDAAAKFYGGCDIYIGDDGLIYA